VPSEGSVGWAFSGWAFSRWAFSGWALGRFALVSEPAAEMRHITINGQQIGYRLSGEGPAIVLIHGLASSSATWRLVAPQLAAQHTVVALDLMGHGESAKPRGDYSLGAHASTIRDLMLALDIERATFVGHSFGGGIAMQLAYQFPERCERLVLVASGGLGKEVSPLLRAVALPGAELILPLVLSGRIHAAIGAVGSRFRRLGLRLDDGKLEMWDNYTALTSPAGRLAFVSTVREVIDLAGQRVSAQDKLYLAAGIPILIVWGDRDAIIPVSHGRAAHEAIAGSRLEILESSGHFLPLQDADRLSAVVTDFVATTEAAPADGLAFGEALRRASGATAVIKSEPATGSSP
jgi:pimeloyl-ACP methyl ester carboxylesterase